MPEPRSAIVIGGSVGGLLTGLMLRRAGWRVDVYERVAGELAGRGAGIVVQPGLIARLAALGISTAGLGLQVTVRKILAVDGSISTSLDCTQTLAAWERVFSRLRAAFPAANYHAGRALTAFSQTGNGITAHFGDGGSASADFLVGADGFRSTVRLHCLPELAPHYAGYVAWRALLDARDIPSGVGRALLDSMSFGLPPGEQFLGYPVAARHGDPHAEQCYNIVWYRPAEEKTELRDLLTDDDGKLHELSIPPALIRRRAVLEMRTAAEKLLAPPFREIVRIIEEPLLQPVYDLEAPQLAFGRVAIVGDAACVARPHVAAGVAKAAEDGVALCEALARESDVETALKSFEAARRPVNRRIVERARHLGAYLQATQTAEEAARSRYHSVPEAVLAETALLDFLNGA